MNSFRSNQHTEISHKNFRLIVLMVMSSVIISCRGGSTDDKLQADGIILDSMNSDAVDTFNAEPTTNNPITTAINQTDVCGKLESGEYHITELVTDVFLTAGQSNATGNLTTYDPDNAHEDQINTRLLVWTENNTWEVANPRTQTWHNGQWPSKGNNSYNHPAFQIGRALANSDECRVVAFIATAASGMPIDFWRNNDDNHYESISQRVTNALNELPNRYDVDMIWWMQGEADNDQIVSRYFYKLHDLIAKFRSENWFDTDGYFLANETGWFEYANEAIRQLRTDDDAFTDYSRGQDADTDRFPANASDGSNPVHFNEFALRKIGNLVAEKYVYEYLPMVSNSVDSK